MRVFVLSIGTVFLLSISGCSAHPQQSIGAIAPAQLDVPLDSSEAAAALQILYKRQRNEPIDSRDWQILFASDGYTHLKEREAAMGRAFTDSSFRAFLMSDTLLARAADLKRVLPELEPMDVSAAARRALAYLPAGTRLHARLFLEIKPITNSFVFTGRDSTPSIFLYVDPRRTLAQLENTISHELHHIGLNSACPDRSYSKVPPAQAMLLQYLGGFGEGQAMLAAAGSPDVHPHATDDDSIQKRWDRDVAHAPADIEDLSRFFESVLDGRIASADSVARQGRTYFGVQGPWYTVGWLMASTIERQLGRDVLVGSLCDPPRFLLLYNTAATRAKERGAHLPTWKPELIERLVSLSRNAD